MTTIKLKNGSGAPTAGDLVAGEPALDLTNKRLYTEDSGGTVIEVGTNPGTDVTFANNRKAIFGANSDLQIFHDGSSTGFIQSSTSDIEIKVNGGGNFKVGDEFGNHLLIVNDNGDVQLKHGSTPALKLATTATGIDVTGTVIADAVGIGTSSPSSILTAVSGASADETVLTIANDYSTADAAGHASGLMFQLYRSYASSLNDAAFIKAEKEQAWDASGDRDSALTFGTRSGGTEPTERMRIDSSGNVTVKASGADQARTLSLQGTNGASETYQFNLIADGENAAAKFMVGVGGGTATERMRIDSSGNVGIGMTPASSVLLDLQEPGSSNDLIVGLSAGTGARAQLRSIAQSDGTSSAVSIHTTSGGATSERMRIDSSGNVGIGTSSVDTKLHLEESDTTSVFLKTQNSAGALLVGNNSAGNSFVSSQTSGKDLLLETNNTERMRIDSSGNLLIGASAQTFGEKLYVEANGTGANTAYFNFTSSDDRAVIISRHAWSTGTTSRVHVVFLNDANSEIGSISATGTTTSYNTSSDQRLKENIVDAPSASDDIDAIQVRSFDWKATGSHQKYGMVAQELQTVAPEAVSAPEDPEKMMGVDYSKLVPMLVKEIQSLRARVAQLESN